MDTYLVTGGAGFIGSHFVRMLLEREPEAMVLNVDRLTYAGSPRNLGDALDHPRHRLIRADICDRAAMKALFREHRIHAVVNFAAESHVDRSIRDASPFVRTNVQGTLSLLDAARSAWETPEGDYPAGCLFLQISTDEVYGSLGPRGSLTEEAPLHPRNPYSASKASADLLALSYASTYGMPVCILRSCNNYGPCQHPEKLIPLVIGRTLLGREIPIYGDGLQVRDWIFVEDHCRAALEVLRAGRPGQVYNVSAGQECTNLELVSALLRRIRLLGGPDGAPLIRHVPDRKGHDRRYALDSSKLRRELGWRPATSWEEGLSRTVEWYWERSDWMKRALE